MALTLADLSEDVDEGGAVAPPSSARCPCLPVGQSRYLQVLGLWDGPGSLSIIRGAIATGLR
jgi:hypothetical protein